MTTTDDRGLDAPSTARDLAERAAARAEDAGRRPSSRGRTVPTVPPDAMITAAAHLSREWGDGPHLGYAGRWAEHTTSGSRVWHIFQAVHFDGSRWLIGADRWGNVRDFPTGTPAELAAAAALDVEVTP